MADQPKIEVDPAAQDIMGTSTSSSEPNPETLDALDKLYAEKQAEKNATEGVPAVKPKEGEGATPPEKKEGEGGTPPEKKEGEGGTPPEKKEGEGEGGTPPEKKEGEDGTPPSKETIDDIDLPPEAKPKSHEAFARVKEWARKEVEDREAQIKALKVKVDELSSKPALTEEEKAEIEELRRFRAKFDVEADPSFKTYDDKVTRAHEFIYAQLRKASNVTDEVIAKIKEYGGPEKVKMDELLKNIDDPDIVRAVNAKLADIAATRFDKEQAIEEAKKNADKFVEERRQQWQQAATAHNEATKEQLDGIFNGLSWVKELTPKEGASEEAIAAAKDHNVFVSNVRKELEAALQDDSPRMRAALLAGMAQLFYANRAATIKDAQIKSLEKTITTLQAKIEKIQNASVTRLRTNPAVGDPNITKPKDSSFVESTGEALDRLRAEQMRARQT